MDEKYLIWFKDLPKLVRVGPMFFNLKIVEPDVMNEEGPMGMTRKDLNEIVVRLTGNLSQDLNTILHEINHAIFAAQDLGDKSTEEEVVIRITNGELALLMDNPRLRDWLYNTVCSLMESAEGQL